jgi:hypothetical protein
MMAGQPLVKGGGVQPCGKWFNKSHQCNETPIKSMDMKAQMNFPGQYFAYCNTLMCFKVRILQNSPYASLPLAASISFCYNKTIILSIALFWVLGVILPDYQTWVDSENFKVGGSLSEVKMTPRTLNLKIGQSRGVKYSPTSDSWWKKSFQHNMHNNCNIKQHVRVKTKHTTQINKCG